MTTIFMAVTNPVDSEGVKSDVFENGATYKLTKHNSTDTEHHFFPFYLKACISFILILKII